MREVEEYMKEFQHRTDLLLEEKFDDAFIGVELENGKPIYDVDKMEKIFQKEGKDIYDIDREVFAREGEKPIYFSCFEKGLAAFTKELKKMFKNKKKF